ncbi:MAG: hypothetical protein LH473_01560 [Chitinophagales bacterium]|nr:hypothetical protein [Chitinophagales bacterium]
MIALKQTNFLKHEVDINPNFESENLRNERKAKLNSLWITLLIHGALILLFMYFVLRPPDPPLSESGVFLNLGISDLGMGDVQPMGSAEVLQTPAPENSSLPEKQTEEDVVTQETKDDVPVIQKKEEQKKNTPVDQKKTETTPTKKTEIPPKETPPKPQPKALYPGNETNNSTGEGTDNVAGDKGKPNGDPFGTDYSGNPGVGNGGPGGFGPGGAPQLGMSGRKIIFFSPINDNSQKTGRVVVNIKVDKQGNVVWAKATQKGSTTTETYLFQLAEDAALKTKVNADASAAEEQFGTITYTFKVK